MTVRVDAPEAHKLIANGIRVLDVLPSSIYEQEHLPGAASLPLETFRPDQVESWDRSAPLLVYCFDQHCDLSSRAGARLESLGFTAVHDLIGGRAAWTALGYPTEGSVGDRRRIADYVEVADAVPIDGTVGDVLALGPQEHPVPVTDDARVLLGAVDPAATGLPPTTPVADVMIPSPGTIRPEMRIDDVVKQLAEDGLDHVLVTAVDGSLVGRVVVGHFHV
jgi:rhodanese-related sulfurtransferase/CBS domain-containing protein